MCVCAKGSGTPTQARPPTPREVSVGGFGSVAADGLSGVSMRAGAFIIDICVYFMCIYVYIYGVGLIGGVHTFTHPPAFSGCTDLH